MKTRTRTVKYEGPYALSLLAAANFKLISVLLLFLSPQGLQHEVVHPTDPFGLPLDFQTLPGQLREVGKQLSQDTVLSIMGNKTVK